MLKEDIKSEVPEFYHRYIDRVDTTDVLYFLEQQAESFSALIEQVEEKIYYQYAEGKWTIAELLGHTIDTERIMAWRALAISRGDGQSLPGFDENAYVSHGNFTSRSAKSFRTEFISLRKSNLDFFRTLSAEMLQRKGLANGNPVTVRGLLWIVAGHCAHHVEILTTRYLQN